MTDQEDKEIQAMKTVIESLQSLDAEARTRVLQYVFGRLGISTQPAGPSQPSGLGTLAPVGATREPGAQAHATVHDIRTLKDEKKPRSANQMAALVAHYVSELAPPGERKDSIGTADITKYFKQAGFRLPKQPRVTLANARNAGYFDPAGEGLYRLNPVGYNLVVHSLPEGAKERVATKRRARRRAPRKKA